MPFSVEPFEPEFVPQKPEETADEMLVQVAKWDCEAKVSITNEAGRSFKVGFVQVLYENEITLTYVDRITEVTCGPLPVLDAPRTDYSPWYWKPVRFSPKVNGEAGTCRVMAKMHDSPQDPISFTHELTGSDLINVKYRLKFKTWLVVRDLTTQPYPNTFVAVLAQFNPVINQEYRVDVSKPVGSRATFATGADKKTRCEKCDPPTAIHSSVWVQAIANDRIGVDHKVRNVVQAAAVTPDIRGTLPGGVRDRIAAAPPIMGMAQATAPKKSGGLFSKFKRRGADAPMANGE